MADVLSMLNSFFGGGPDMGGKPDAIGGTSNSGYGSLQPLAGIEEVDAWDPKQAKREQLSRALASFAQSIGGAKTPFLNAIGPAIGAGVETYHDTGAYQRKEKQSRAKALLDTYLDQAKVAREERKLANEEKWRTEDRAMDEKKFTADQTYRADSLAPKPTGDMLEYEAAVKQGYKGSIIDYQKEVKGAGRAPGIVDQVNDRKQAAAELGLSPDHPAYQSFILTGKFPREDAQELTATDKKAILEADEMVASNQNAIDLLRSVITPGADGKTLNEKASFGSTAGMESFVARNDPFGLLNATGIVDADRGAATTDLSNIVLGQALGTLKATFGAAPTEGERKILVDLQASVDKTPRERKAILDRAIRMAERRLKFNQDRANSLRDKTFYRPKEPSQGSADQPPANADAMIARAKAAIAKGADPEKVRERLRSMGIEPDF